MFLINDWKPLPCSLYRRDLQSTMPGLNSGKYQVCEPHGLCHRPGSDVNRTWHIATHIRSLLCQAKAKIHPDKRRPPRLEAHQKTELELFLKARQGKFTQSSP